MLHGLYVVLFSIATGFTVSGIIGNLYRLLFRKPQTTAGRTAELGVLVFAGPSLLIGRSYKAVRKGESSRVMFWIAAAVSAYWSLVIGMISLRVLFAI